MNLKMITAGSLAAGLLLIATPAFANQNNSGKGSGNDGWHFGAFIAALPHLGLDMNGNGFVNADRVNGKSTTTVNMTKNHPFASSSVEIGVIGGVNGSTITLDPAIDLNGTSTAATNVVTNASTTFKGGATSTASFTSGEKVIVVGTTSSSTPGTITASIVIALKNAWHFCAHLLSR